jgi:hypothetical protein
MAVGFVEPSPSYSRVFVCLGTTREFKRGWLSSVASFIIEPRNKSCKTMRTVILDEGTFGMSSPFPTGDYYSLTTL